MLKLRLSDKIDVKAINHTSCLRVFMLFFLLVSRKSFSFLEWKRLLFFQLSQTGYTLFKDPLCFLLTLQPLNDSKYKYWLWHIFLLFYHKLTTVIILWLN